MAKKQPTRAEVLEELTWNVADIFATEAEFKQAIQQVEDEIVKIQAFTENATDSASQLLALTKLLYGSEELLLKVYGYAARVNDGDTADPHGNDLMNQALLIVNKWEAAVSFYDPKVTQLTTHQLEQFLADEPELKQYEFNLRRIQEQAAHTLSPAEEKILAQLQPAIDDASDISSKLDDADLDFGMIKDENGEEVQLTNATASEFATSADQDMRMRASKQVAKAYRSMRNTFGATLKSHVHAQNIMAEIRHFDSARQMNLADQKIPEAVYDTLINTTHEHLDLMHDYYAFRKEFLGLDQMYQFDRHVPLVADAKLSLAFEEGKKATMEALAPLGKDYQEYLQEEFEQRWIDAAENKGKRSGGYEDDVYGVHPYILLNWNDIYDSTSTLAHESGHALQSVYTDKAQPFWYSQYPIFIAEIASTLNESLLNHYMLEKYADDPKIKAFILTQDVDNFIGTVYRQTLFAEFEHFIYTEDAKGTTLTPDLMADKFNGLFKEYNGGAVSDLPWKDDTWAQIPHFYYDYYVYQYATSKAIATALADDIISGKPGALENYKKFLSAGASDYPVEIVKKAGVDVTKRDYLDHAFKLFGEEVEELKQIL
jgi:oligoendopeptidase F